MSESLDTRLTDKQKQVCRHIITLGYEHGMFGFFSIRWIAEKFGMTEAELYDNNTNTGLLWELGPHGEGMLVVSSRAGTDDGGWVIKVRTDCLHELEGLCDFRL